MNSFEEEYALFEEEQRIAAAIEAQLAKAGEEWREKWPNYCRGCHGTGGSVIYNYPHAPNDFDVCEALDVVERCHRCGLIGLDADANGPCKHCGWTGQAIDDADPSAG